MTNPIPITTYLTIGQLTFTFRVAIQILTYVGIFLLGRLTLAYAPSVAVTRTHDVINRRVGMSTATLASMQWIKKRLFGRPHQGDNTSRLMVLAILLSLVYGLFSALSDIGFIGLEACQIPGGTVVDSPASIRSMDDAKERMASRMVEGLSPDNVPSFRCDASSYTDAPPYDKPRPMCTAWRNTTYADTSDFRQLNLTDTDSLMPHHLRPNQWNFVFRNVVANFTTNSYFVGNMGGPLAKGTVGEGLAIVPHDTGVVTIVGLPDLPPFSKVAIPRTLAAETNFGCLPLGVSSKGEANPIDSAHRNEFYDYFLVDEDYLRARDARYTGPEVLRPVLSKYADEVREILLHTMFNSSTMVDNSIKSVNQSSFIPSWGTEARLYMLPGEWEKEMNRTNTADVRCTIDIGLAVNASSHPSTEEYDDDFGPVSCALFHLSGSRNIGGSAIQEYEDYVCGSTTQINMVSATITVDGEGNAAYSIINLPSDLHTTVAMYYLVIWDPNAPPNVGNNQLYSLEPVVRYALSDNPSGQVIHYIEQSRTPLVFGKLMSVAGAGSVGAVLGSVGATIMTLPPEWIVGRDSEPMAVINSTYFSAQYDAKVLTRWAGQASAALLRGSLTLNPWTALDKPPMEVRITGGVSAVCYRLQYMAAVAPFFLSAVLILLWAAFVAVRGRMKGVNAKADMYGGLGPIIVAPRPVRLDQDEVLAWQSEPSPHLVTIPSSVTGMKGESEHLLGQFDSRSRSQLLPSTARFQSE